MYLLGKKLYLYLGPITWSVPNISECKYSALTDKCSI